MPPIISTTTGIAGVVPAIVTPIDGAGAPDALAFLDLAAWLLADGADGLNVLGTTGEATSFSTAQRLSLMRAVGRSSLPHERLMVGTGAAAVADAVTLTQVAAGEGFAGALLLPPFYYKGVPEDGIVRYIDTIATATRESAIPLYLYNFPAMAGVAYAVPLVERLIKLFGERIAGLKDSSGDLAYARAVAALSNSLKVFPSNEASLMEARDGPFAGCISASAGVNAALCARAFRAGDERALDAAVRIRKLFDGLPFVPAVKGALAQRLGKPSLAAVQPPFVELPEARAKALAQAIEGIHAET
ncbi:MAG: dihydrodipicolinate synthase family protein [Hyphomicrobiales bacterium]